jgi:hypothetical protein
MRNVRVDFGKDTLINKNQPKKNKIYFDGISYEGKFIKSGVKCRFLWSKDKDYGYKIFTNDFPKNIPPTEEEVRLVFSIQKLLFDNGFSPYPYEIIKCHDDTREYFVIKMETIMGGRVKSKKHLKKWVHTLEKFCKENKIGSDRKDHPLDVYGHTNCIKSNKDNKIYLVDVDIRFRFMEN